MILDLVTVGFAWSMHDGGKVCCDAEVLGTCLGCYLRTRIAVQWNKFKMANEAWVILT